MLNELWAELTGAQHLRHVAIPWGLWMLVGFLGAAAAAIIVRLRRRNSVKRPEKNGDR